jgi:PAS domain S-box-containing protein
VNKRVHPLVVAIILIGLITALFRAGRGPDFTLHERLAACLEQFRLHDAETSRDVLRARAGMLPNNYDALAADRRNLLVDLGAIDALVRGASAGPAAELGKRFVALDEATRQKLVTVEDFKSENAILRNSLAYFTQDGPAQQSLLADRAEADRFGRLAYAVLRYLQDPAPATGDEIHALLDTIAAKRGADAELPMLIRHGEMIRTRLPRVDQEASDAVAAPTGRLAQELDAASETINMELARRAHLFLILMWIAAIALIAYIAYQIKLLSWAADTLRRANDDLRAQMLSRAEAHRALRDSESRFRAITDAAPEAIISFDIDGVIHFWNRGAEVMFGYAADEVRGEHVGRLTSDPFTPGEPALADLFMPTIKAATPATYRLTGKRHDGTRFPIEASLSSWSDAQGTYVSAVMRDITEREELRRQARDQELRLIQASRMTTLGQLAAGIAHEIKSPNSAIDSDARGQQTAWPSILGRLDTTISDPLQETLAGRPYAEMRADLPAMTTNIIEAAAEVTRIVDEVQSFVQSEPATVGGSFDVNGAVARATRMLRHQIQKRTDRFELQLRPDLPAAAGDPRGFGQVVVNLVINALEALPDRTRAVTVRTGMEDGRVIVVVEDEGVGIPEANLSRICEPYFSTKAATGGTGLGLALSSNILHSFGAELRFQRGAERGTLAIVLLAPFVAQGPRA